MKVRLVAIFEGFEVEDIVEISEEAVQIFKEEHINIAFLLEKMAKDFAMERLEYFGEIIKKGEENEKLS